MAVVDLVIRARDTASQTLRRVSSSFNAFGRNIAGVNSSIRAGVQSVQASYDRLGSFLNRLNPFSRGRGGGGGTAPPTSNNPFSGFSIPTDQFRALQDQINSVSFGPITRMVSEFRSLGDVIRSAGDVLQLNFVEQLPGVGAAMQTQLDVFTTASGLSAQAGITFDEAQLGVARMNERLSEAAAALPGATADYAQFARMVTDNVLPSFTEGGNFDQTGFEDALAQLSENFVALSAGAGLNVGSTAMGVSRALGGSSLASLQQLEFFENMPQVTAYIEKRLQEEFNTDDFGDLDVAERLQVLQDAAATFMTDEFKDAATGSVSGIVEGFRSYFFDPTVGLFGLMRDLDLDTEGAQTAFDTFNRTMGLTFGSDGIFFKFGALLSKLGINLGDPMQMLSTGLDYLNRGLEGAIAIVDRVMLALDHGTSMMRAITGFSSGSVVFEKVKTFLGGMFTMIGDRLVTGYQWLLTNLVPIFNRGFELLNQFLRGVNWMEVGGTIGRVFGQIIGNIGVSLTQLDWGEILVFIGNAALALIQVIGSFVGGFQAGLQSSIPEMGKNIVDAFMGGLRNVFMVLKQGFMSFIDNNLNAILQVIRLLPGGSAIVASVNGLRTAMAGGQGAIASSSLAMPISNVQVAPAMAATTANAFGSGLTARPSWMGSVGTAAQGLFEAARAEAGRMPSGANLVVANSSEAIIPRGAAMGMRPVSLSIGTIQVNGASGDGRGIAQQVIAEIQRYFEEELNGQLS